MRLWTEDILAPVVPLSSGRAQGLGEFEQTIRQDDSIASNLGFSDGDNALR